MLFKVFENEKISYRQLQILIIANNLALSLILLPELFFHGFVLNMFFLLLGLIIIADLILKFDNLELNQKILKAIYIFLMSKMIFSTGFELNLFMDIVKKFILPETNKWIICLIMILTGNYLVMKGYEVRARLCEILVWLLILPLIIFFVINIFGIKRIGFENNILCLDARKIFYGIFVFSPLDYLFLINMPKQNKTEINLSQKKIFSMIFFVWLISFIFIYLMRLKINFDLKYGILKLMSLTDLPGGFLQGQDFFVTSFVIVSFFILISGKIFFIRNLLKNISDKNLNWICLLIFLPCLISKKILWLMICVASCFIYFFVLNFVMIKKFWRTGDKK